MVLTDLGKKFLEGFLLALLFALGWYGCDLWSDVRRLTAENEALRKRPIGTVYQPTPGVRNAWFKVGEYNGMKMYLMVEEAR